MHAAGDIQSVHYDKRGAKVTIAYEGDDCGGKKDEVEQAATKFCTDNAAMASVGRRPRTPAHRPLGHMQCASCCGCCTFLFLGAVPRLRPIDCNRMA